MTEYLINNKMEELNDKQKRFCHEYIKDFNGANAAIRAGYGEKGASATASRMLNYVNIKAYLDSLQAKMREESQIDAQWILEKFKLIADLSLRENKQGKIDAHGASRALENIAKHMGWYEKDNSQLKSPSTIKIEIVDPKDE